MSDAAAPAAAPAVAPAAPADEPKVMTAGPLIANFKSFAGDKSAYFMKINLEYTNDACNFINGPEGFTPEEILTMLTDHTQCKPYCDSYIKVAKTAEAKQEGVCAEITKLIEDFMGKKVQGCKVLKEQKAAAAVDPETATLLAEFTEHVATKTQTHTTPAFLKLALDYLPEGFHKADIKTALTDTDDCEEFLETYLRLAVVPGTEKLRVRGELLSFVETFAESKGIVKEDAFEF
jgi:hypothetical protein